MKLYEIVSKYREILEDDDLTPDRKAEILDNASDLYEKFGNVIKYIRNLEGDETAIKTEIARLRKKQNAAQTQINWLKDYLMSSLKGLGKRRYQTELFTISICKSQPRVVIIDEDAIPDEFVRLLRQIDKSKISRHLKETGEIIEGIEIANGEHLRIN